MPFSFPIVEVAASRKPRSLPGLTPAEELARVIAATPRPFRIQFVGAAPDGGPITLTEVEIQAADASAAIVARESRLAASNDRIAHSRRRRPRSLCATEGRSPSRNHDEETHNRVFLDALENLIDVTEHGE